MDWLNKLSEAAQGVGAAYQSFQTPATAPTVPTSAAPNNAAGEKKPNWLLIGGVAAGLLAVVYFITRK